MPELEQWGGKKRRPLLGQEEKQWDLPLSGTGELFRLILPGQHFIPVLGF